MAPHQQRVVDEKTSLDEKIEKLQGFIQANAIYRTLPGPEQERLGLQLHYMCAYSTVLGERIENFGE